MLHDPETALKRIWDKYRRNAPLAAENGILPYRSGEGRWIASPHSGNSWWTGGFWPGLMWLLYAYRQDDFFMTEARRVQELLCAEFRRYDGLHHDMGFMYLLSVGADWKITGNRQSRSDVLHAASLLMSRMNPKGFIRAWNGEEQKGYAIIDCMMNLSLLFKASELTGDPRFAHTACIHADTTLREFIRPDGSVSHIIEFDPQTGARVREHPGQGYALGTAWSRGQAWGLYGFTLAYLYTGDMRYRDAAKRIASFFVSHIRPDGLTDCDFLQPERPERIDNLAGAIGACGLIELARAVSDSGWRSAAERLLDGMLSTCCDFSDENILGILTRCTASYHDDGAGVDTNIVYGDYFLTEALAKLCNKDPMLWK